MILQVALLVRDNHVAFLETSDTGLRRLEAVSSGLIRRKLWGLWCLTKTQPPRSGAES